MASFAQELWSQPPELGAVCFGSPQTKRKKQSCDPYLGHILEGVSESG